jgi:tetratricopeptide (TPR) repeat protein
MSKVYLLIFLSLAARVLPAQVNTDSLWQIWKDSSRPDTTRIEAIQHMAWNIMFTDPDSGSVLAHKELEFAEKIGDKWWQGKALNVIGTTYNLKGEYAAALATYQKALVAMAEATGAVNQKRGIGAIYNNVGLIYRSMGEGPKALEYFQKDLALQEERGDQEAIANAYNNIGNVYDDQSNNARALEYYQKGLALQHAMNDEPGMATSYNNIGNVHLNEGAYDKALEFYNKALELRKKLKDERGIAIALANIGLVYQEQDQPRLALGYVWKSIDILERIGENPELATSYYSLGFLYANQKDYPKALELCKKSLLLSRSINAVKTERDACDCLYQTYKATGQHELALEYHEQFLALNDSLEKDATSQRLEQMEFARQVLLDSIGKEEEKQEIKMKYQSALNLKTKSLNVVLIAGIIILLLALALLGRMLYFQKKSERFQSQAGQLEKQQLISEIDLLRTQVNPHFLFNSLSILSSLVHVNADLSEQFIQQLSRLYRYILEQKDRQLVPLRTELDFLNSYVFLLKIRFENKFELRVNLDEADTERYKIVPLTLQLLVENAVKHNQMSAKEPLVVEAFIENDCLVVKNRIHLRQHRDASTGTGLNSIINRYTLLSEFPVWAGEEQGYFVVRVPLLQ